LKQRWQIFSTEEGIQVDESDEHLQNAERSIHDTLQLNSKITVERLRHSAKQ
jgi:hypothetical protein